MEVDLGSSFVTKLWKIIAFKTFSFVIIITELPKRKAGGLARYFTKELINWTLSFDCLNEVIKGSVNKRLHNHPPPWAEHLGHGELHSIQSLVPSPVILVDIL